MDVRKHGNPDWQTTNAGEGTKPAVEVTKTKPKYVLPFG